MHQYMQVQHYQLCHIRSLCRTDKWINTVKNPMTSRIIELYFISHTTSEILPTEYASAEVYISIPLDPLE